MIEIKILITVVSAVLKWIGESFWHNAQRYILPVIYSGTMSYLSGCWWLGLTTLPMIGPIDLGYKDYGRNDPVSRALWLFVICVVAGLVPTLTGHLPWVVYGPYCVFSGFIGTLTRNINNAFEAPICGAWIAFPIWFVH